MALHNAVFKDQIWAWFCNDMDSCLKVSKDLQDQQEKSTFKGGLNFPAALTMFAVIELVAGYYAGKRPSYTDVAKFVSRYVGRYCPRLADRNVAKHWYDVFRHGLSHQWSPKFGAVAMDFRIQEVFVFSSQGRREKIPHLIVPKLFEVLKGALRDYEADLDSDAALRGNFEKRYAELLSHDRVEMETLRKLCGE